MSNSLQENKSEKNNNNDKSKSSKDRLKDPIVIRKYANRRLYNTQNSKYINLDDLREMVCHNVNFIVIDCATNTDLTRAVLSQIILDAEIKGDHIFPITFLRKIIQVYDNEAEKYIFPNFLEETMSYYKKNQNDIMSTINTNITNLTKITDFSKLQEINQKNYEMLLNSFGMLYKDKDKDKRSNKTSLDKQKADKQEVKHEAKTKQATSDMHLRINLLEQQFENFQNLITTFVSTKDKDKD